MSWKNIVRALAITTTMVIFCSAQVRPIADTRSTQAFPAINTLGPTHITVRQLWVDLNLPNGAKGRGRVEILFDSTTGVFFHMFQIERNSALASWTDYFLASTRIVSAPDRILVITFGNSAGVLESIEKAASLEEAESKSIEWINNHIDVPETMSYESIVIGILRSDYPKGFLPEGSELDATGYLHVKLVDVIPDSGGWDLVLQSPNSGSPPPKAMVRIERKGKMWVRDLVVPYHEKNRE